MAALPVPVELTEEPGPRTSLEHLASLRQCLGGIDSGTTSPRVAILLIGNAVAALLEKQVTRESGDAYGPVG